MPETQDKQFEALCRKLEKEMIELSKTTINGEVWIGDFWEGFDFYDESETEAVAEVMEAGLPYCEFYHRNSNGTSSLAVHPGPLVQKIQLLWVHDPYYQDVERTLIPANAKVLFALLVF
jgi:hypothetical protein